MVQADIDPLDPATESGGSRPSTYANTTRAFRDREALRHPSAWVRKVTVRRAGRTAHRRLLEARALARVLAGRGPAVAELPEEDAEV
jgi:hypothetical protein